MQSIEFGDVKYIVTIDYPNCGGVTCYGCETMDEVFKVFTEDLKELMHFAKVDDPDILERFGDDADSIMQLVEYSDIIKNPSIINYLYNRLYDDIFGMDFCVFSLEEQVVVFNYEYDKNW